MGIGADVRQALLRTSAGTLAGTTIPTPRTAAVMATTGAGLDWPEFPSSDDAQQLSACACVKPCSDPDRCESPLCIVHSPPAQHAMRASALGIHPAQTAPFPPIRASVKAVAERRRTIRSTPKNAPRRKPCQKGACKPDQVNMAHSQRKTRVESTRHATNITASTPTSVACASQPSPCQTPRRSETA